MLRAKSTSRAREYSIQNSKDEERERERGKTWRALGRANQTDINANNANNANPDLPL